MISYRSKFKDLERRLFTNGFDPKPQAGGSRYMVPCINNDGPLADMNGNKTLGPTRPEHIILAQQMGDACHEFYLR